MRYHLLFPLLFVSLAGSAAADCQRCEYYRQKNAEAPPPKHEYYEDYLKSAGEKQDGVQGREIAPGSQKEKG